MYNSIAYQEESWDGQNIFGEILMALRRLLQSEKSASVKSASVSVGMLSDHPLEEGTSSSVVDSEATSSALNDLPPNTLRS